jgi:uncharacterized protein DUF4397
MNTRTRVVLQLATVCFVLGSYGFAASDAYLYIVHGIPGRDLADNLNPGLPIDVFVNGKYCLTRGLTFGNTSVPFTLAAGTYDVQISMSNTLDPCTNPALVDSQVTLTPGESLSAVAAISSTAPVLLQFSDELGAVAPGNARFVFGQAADAPELAATLTQLYVKNPQTFVVISEPGAEQWVGVPTGTYSVQITAVGSTTVLTSEQITLPDQSVTLSYAVGELLNNTVGLVNRTVRDVF